ncbi:hypothetical protein V1514DRAFT_354471 [Lipomyces japonicus]|uniref:uncharacterized protein n=1 Tax=Lipomyces japonicus TaxID=56871 RepID=UPI0034CEFD22
MPAEGILGPGFSAPLLIQKLTQHLVGSGALSDPAPQLSSTSNGSSLGISACRNLHDWKVLIAEKDQKANTVTVPVSSHVHNFVVDDFYSSTGFPGLPKKSLIPIISVTADISVPELPEDVDVEAPGTDRTSETADNTVKVICLLCRVHVKLQIQDGDLRTCAGQDQLHHFIPGSSKVTDNLEIYEYQCYISGTRLFVSIQKPHLDETVVSSFREHSINERIKRLNEDLISRGEEPLKPPNPRNSYQILNRILKDVVEQKNSPKSIRSDNLSLMLKLDADLVLPVFGFIKNKEQGLWVPPSLFPATSESEAIEDVIDQSRMEIAILLRAETRNLENPLNISLVNEGPTLKKALKFLNYSIYDRITSFLEPTNPIALRFASLGAIHDFSDSLILQTFDRQINCDPMNSSYYLECLRELSTYRQSEELQIRVVELQSLGISTREDLQGAYRVLGMDPDTVGHDSGSNSLILGIYKARLRDAPSTATKMKEALQIIADARGSTEIKSFLQTENLDENTSYSVLEVNRDTEDQLVIASYNFKLKEDPEKVDLYNSAITMVAKERRSPILLTFIEGLNLTGPLPDIDAAFGILGVQKNMIEDDYIMTVYTIRIGDNPEEIIPMRNALRVIAKYRNSRSIQHFLSTGDTNPSAENIVSKDVPAGLQNIGNTCYLNSLLQYYFTIKPLRELSIEFDSVPQENATEAVARGKRIGGRIVTDWEIDRGQAFVRELGGLFNSLIHSTESFVAPNHQLAYLALVSSKEELEEQNKRDTFTTAPEADIAMTEIDNNSVVYGPAPKPESPVGSRDIPFEISSDDDENLVTEIEPDTNLKENISPISPIKSLDVQHSPLPQSGERHVLGELKSVYNNKLSNSESPIVSKISKDFVGSNTAESDDSNLNSKLNLNSALTEVNLTAEESKKLPLLLLPPPPRPERPSSRSNGSMMFGNQQDVTECIENVLFQVEAALKPELTDDDGEQVDLIKQLFYGKTKQTLEVKSETTEFSLSVRTKIERFSHLIVDVASGPRDIYDALDSYFDVETVDLDGKSARRYVTLTDLPPILQIQVQRVQFDRDKGQIFKSNAPLLFDQTIYLDRYTDNVSVNEASGETVDIKKKREEVWRWKEELETFRRRKSQLLERFDKSNSLNALETLECTAQWLSQVKEATIGFSDAVSEDADIDNSNDCLLDSASVMSHNENDVRVHDTLTEVIDKLNEDAARLNDEILALTNQITKLEAKIGTQYSSLKSLGYSIHSVFIHRGEATHGHYWVYIYDFDKKVFRKYNDEHVSEVDIEEVIPFVNQHDPDVLRNYDRTTATPYFLVFVRDNIKDNLIETVKRILPDRGEITTVPTKDARDHDSDTILDDTKSDHEMTDAAAFSESRIEPDSSASDLVDL